MELKTYRRERLRMAAHRYAADVLVASLPQNITYATSGYVSVNQFVLCSTQSYLIYLPKADHVIYVVGHGEIPSVLEFEQGEAEIFCYGSFRFCYHEAFSGAEAYRRYEENTYPSAQEALAAALNRVCKTGDRVAFDYSRVPFATASYVHSHVAGVEFLDGVPVFALAKRVKAPQEIAGLERSAEIAEQGLLEALRRFKPGDTEQDLERSFKRYLGEFGAKQIFFVATANLRAAYSDTVNQPAPIGVGSMIRFDYGCEWNGYSSDLARTVSVGAPSDQVRRCYDAVLAGTNAAIAAAKPGVSAGKLFQIAMEETKKAGIPHYRRHHVGHGIGLEVYDSPSLAPGDDTALEENMVINVETPYYELGWGGVQVEDTIAIIRNGSRRLDKTDNGLIILDV